MIIVARSESFTQIKMIKPFRLSCFFLASLFVIASVVSLPARAAENDLELLLSLMSERKCEEALPVAQRYLESVKQLQFLEEEQSVEDNLGWIYFCLGRYSESEYHSLRSLELANKFVKPDLFTIASINISLAQLYKAQGRCSEAETRYLAGIKIGKESADGDLFLVKMDVNDLEKLYQDEICYKDPQVVLRKIYEVRELAFGKNHVDTVRARKKLEEPRKASYLCYESWDDATSVMSMLLEEFEENALKSIILCADKTLDLEETKSDPGKQSSVLRILGTTYSRMGQYAKAEDYLKQAMALPQSSLELQTEYPELKYNLAITLSEFAGVLSAQERSTEAETLLKQPDCIIVTLLLRVQDSQNRYSFSGIGMLSTRHVLFDSNESSEECFSIRVTMQAHVDRT